MSLSINLSLSWRTSIPLSGNLHQFFVALCVDARFLLSGRVTNALASDRSIFIRFAGPAAV